MAGDWIKMECSTPDKPEVLAITARMGWEDSDLTVGKLFKLWRWFDQHTTNGNAAGVTSALLDKQIGVTGFVTAVASVGWLSVTESGISLISFEKHNGTTAKTRAQTAKRVSSFKSNAKANARGNGASVTDALPREEKRREEEIAYSAEPQSDSTPENYVIKIPLVDQTDFGITEKHIAEWSESFPAVDVLQQLRSMRQWCLANPTRRKTKRGVSAFIVAWLTKEQDKGRTFAKPVQTSSAWAGGI